MKRLMFAALLAGLFCCCESKDVLKYNIIENVRYDIPIKSSVSLRIELTDSVYTKAQLTEFCESWVRVASATEMKYNPVPTHVFLYIYKSKADCQKDGGSWIAMYSKIGKEDKGEYTYR